MSRSRRGRRAAGGPADDGAAGPAPAGRDQRLLLISVAVSAGFAVISSVWGILSGSSMIVFDGLYSFASVGLSVLAVLGLRFARRGPDERFPWGREAVEPLVVVVKAATLAALCLYAVVGGIGEGGLKARSTRGSIGESWWSKRFLDVLESFALGSRLTRGRNYARAGQVLSLEVGPGEVRARVQGSRPEPYAVTVRLNAYDDATWTRVEAALAEQALFTARLLAGEMPAQIEQVFAEADAPLFPTGVGQLAMQCTCPDWGVPCKHIAATFYLLAEAFDDDPFEILHWRGRDRDTLLEHLRARRSPTPKRSRRPATPPNPYPLGAAAALAQTPGPALAEALDRFWVPPVPLPARPAALVTEVDLLLRQLATPPATLGGAELTDRLRAYYAALKPPPTIKE